MQMTALSPPRRNLLTRPWPASVLLSLLFLPIIMPSTLAQSPSSVCCMAYATVNENTLYVQGGMDISSKNVSPQFFALDLTGDGWDTSSPPWRPVNVSGPVPTLVARVAGHSISVGTDQVTLNFWQTTSTSNDRSLNSFNIITNQWTQLPTPGPLTNTYYSLPAISDPGTGLIYIPNGYANTSMLVYNPANRDASSATMPPIVSLRDWFPAIYSNLRKSILLLGGEGGIGPYFYEYPIPNGPWRQVTTSGPMPPNLIRSCMVSAYNGTKIIFFGGNTVSTISVATIYILDVTTMTWKQGPDADASQARSSMACGVSGDNFVAWGGLQWQPGEASNLPVSNTPIIFNMHTNQWTTKFVRGNRTETQTPDKVDKNNTAAIAGGVAGAIVVIAGALLLIFRKRRQKSQKQKQDNQQHDEHSDTYKLNTYHNQNYYTPPPVPVLAPAPVSMPIPAPVHNNAIINDNNQIYSNYLQSAQLVSTTPNTNGQIYGVYAPTNIQEEKPVTYTQAVPMPIENSQTFVPHGLNVWTGEPSKNPQTLPRPQATINTTTTTVSSPLTMPSSPSTASSRDDYIKHIQHELLMQQTQATAPNNPQYIPARYIQDSNMPARAPQGSGVPISPSLSTSVAGPQAVPLHATTNQELQDQIQQMQAELNRRQWS